MPPATISSGVSFQLETYLDTRHTTQTAVTAAVRSKYISQPWEPCCEKYLIDVQPIEHNCVSYNTGGMQYCSMRHKVWALYQFSKASVYVLFGGYWGAILILGPLGNFIDKDWALPASAITFWCWMIVVWIISFALSGLKPKEWYTKVFFWAYFYPVSA